MHAVPTESASARLSGGLAIPRAVINLWHSAQISHRAVPSAEALWSALQSPQLQPNRQAIAIAIQEATIGEMAALMVDGVMNGATIHRLLTSLTRDGEIRRPDLLGWSEVFV